MQHVTYRVIGVTSESLSGFSVHSNTSTSTVWSPMMSTCTLRKSTGSVVSSWRSASLASGCTLPVSRLMNRHDINTKLGLDSRIEELIYESAANMRTFTTSASQV